MSRHNPIRRWLCFMALTWTRRPGVIPARRPFTPTPNRK